MSSCHQQQEMEDKLWSANKHGLSLGQFALKDI